MRTSLLTLVLLGLACSQPVASQSLPAAAAVAHQAAVQASAEGGLDMEQLVKYALTQGGLTVVCLVLFWWIQREHQRQQSAKDERQQILTTLVEKNTTALVLSAETNARLARAIEHRGVVPPGAGV